jgi:16S rRNA (cytosine967-C5)-methyltransferase
MSEWPRFYSHPAWLVQYFLAHYPAERVAALLEWNNRTPALMLRANRLRTSAEQLAEHLCTASCEIARVGWPTPESLTVAGAIGDLTEADWFVEGLATVQDGAAQLIAHLLAPRPDERIVDWCAAPGGKTTHLAELSDDRAHILALDVDEERLAQVAVQAERLGLRSVRTYPLRPELVEWLASEPADAVLVDAPCTGLGTIQRHPDIRWRRKSRNIETAARLQSEILDAAARCVAPGGRLVYSTCTLGPVENEQVIERFLIAHPQFERAKPEATADPAVRPFVDARGDLHTWPPEHDVDGFYAAKIIRRG